MIPRGPDPVAKGVVRKRPASRARDIAPEKEGRDAIATTQTSRPEMPDLATPARAAPILPGNGAWWWF
jgi:hypothetical protein